MTICNYFDIRCGYRIIGLILIVSAGHACDPLLLCSSARADEPTATLQEDQDLNDRWRAIFDDFSNSLQIHRNGSPLNGLDKVTVLTLVNHQGKSGAQRLGRIYLWTEHGQPFLVASAFTNQYKDNPPRVTIAHELHSLDSQPIEVKRADPLWNCPTAGIEWLQLEGLQRPSSNRALRLVQMRTITRSFEITGAYLDASTETYDVLPQPIYRYEQATDRAQDGAIFVIGQSTDPSAFVLIEARDNAWWVAFARSSVLPLEIERDNDHFYSIERMEGRQNGKPFYIDFVAELRLPNEPEVVLFSRSE